MSNSNKSTVYVVQEILRYDAALGGLVPAFDLTPAADFGEIVFLTQGGKQPLSSEWLVGELRRKLAGFTDADYLLPTGDPVAMCTAAMIAGEVNDGFLRILRWDRAARKYIPVAINLNNGEYDNAA